MSEESNSKSNHVTIVKRRTMMDAEEYVSIQEQISVKWNDPEYNIPWPVSEPNLIFSDRDR